MSSGSFTDEQVHLWLAEVASSAWIGMHYDSPTMGALNNNEVSGGGYTRCLVTFSEPANRTIWLTQDATFQGLTQTQLTHFSVWNQVTGGLMRVSGRIPRTATILTGRGYRIMAGEMAISFG